MLQKLHFRRIWFALGIMLLVVIVTGSLVPVPKIDLPATDKLIHVSMYFLLMAWFAQVVDMRYRLFLAIIFALLGLLLEIAQHATGYRRSEWADALANMTGVMLGWAVSHTIVGKALYMIDKQLARLVSGEG